MISKSNPLRPLSRNRIDSNAKVVPLRPLDQSRIDLATNHFLDTFTGTFLFQHKATQRSRRSNLRLLKTDPRPDYSFIELR
jgi:hypothetical protein